MAIQLQDTGRVTETLCKDISHVYRDMRYVYSDFPQWRVHAVCRQPTKRIRGKKQLRNIKRPTWHFSFLLAQYNININKWCQLVVRNGLCFLVWIVSWHGSWYLSTYLHIYQLEDRERGLRMEKWSCFEAKNFLKLNKNKVRLGEKNKARLK